MKKIYFPRHLRVCFLYFKEIMSGIQIVVAAICIMVRRQTGSLHCSAPDWFSALQ